MENNPVLLPKGNEYFSMESSKALKTLAGIHTFRKQLLQNTQMKYIISSEDIEAETEYAKVLVLQVGCTLKHHL